MMKKTQMRAKGFKSVKSHRFDSYTNYSSGDLRRIADEMDKDNIKSVEFMADYHPYDEEKSFMCYESRTETDAEFAERIAKEDADVIRAENYRRTQYEALKQEFEGR